MLTQQIKEASATRKLPVKLILLNLTHPKMRLLLNTLPKAKFDETVELYANLYRRSSEERSNGTWHHYSCLTEVVKQSE